MSGRRGKLPVAVLAALAGALLIAAVESSAAVTPNPGKYKGEIPATVGTNLNQVKIKVVEKKGVLRARALTVLDDCKTLDSGLPQPLGRVRKGRFSGDVGETTPSATFTAHLEGRFVSRNKATVTVISSGTGSQPGQSCTDTTKLTLKRVKSVSVCDAAPAARTRAGCLPPPPYANP